MIAEFVTKLVSENGLVRLHAAGSAQKDAIAKCFRVVIVTSPKYWGTGPRYSYAHAKRSSPLGCPRKALITIHELHELRTLLTVKRLDGLVVR